MSIRYHMHWDSQSAKSNQSRRGKKINTTFAFKNNKIQDNGKKKKTKNPPNPTAGAVFLSSAQ